MFQGPNFVWHVDAYEKLSTYGFSISGCIDGYVQSVCIFILARKKYEVVIKAHTHVHVRCCIAIAVPLHSYFQEVDMD